VWASPPCTEYSIAKTRSRRNMEAADRIVRRTLEIIEYLRPKVFIIENPATGYLKSRPFMRDIPFYDVTYCKYGYPYRKATRLWTNLSRFNPLYCKKDCGMMVDGKHLVCFGNTRSSDRPWLDSTTVPLRIRYSIPSKLIKQIFKTAVTHINGVV
jgi:hypothetical protein